MKRRPKLALGIMLFLIISTILSIWLPFVKATPTRVQGNARGTTTGNSISVTLGSAPIDGNILVCVIGVGGSGGVTVLSISQANVAWGATPQISEGPINLGGINTRCEIWYGIVSASAGTGITIDLSGNADYGGVADICEYSGMATSSFLDQTAVNTASSGNPDTGTTATTIQASELWIGGTVSANGPARTQSTPTNGFTLFDGAIADPYISLAYLEKIVSATDTANSGTTPSGTTQWLGCIATFKASSGGGGTWTNKIMGIQNANIAKICGVSIVNVNKVMGGGAGGGFYITAVDGTNAGIQAAINTAMTATGTQRTVYIPAGDWQCDQGPVEPYGQGGGIFIDLETLPAGTWLNIIGLYTNTSVTTQNGQTIPHAPNVILRSNLNVHNNLTQPYATFAIVGSNETGGNINAVNSADRHIRISGLTILGRVTDDGTVSSYSNVGIGMSFVDGFLIDHCVIDSNIGSDIGSSYSKGIISHCIMTQYYHKSMGGVWGYGVQVGGNWGYYNNGLGTATWVQNVTQIIGHYDWQGITLNYTTPVCGDLAVKGTTANISFTAGPVYIENCEFNMTRHPVASSAYGYYVLRHSECYGGVGIQAVDQHGGGWSVAANAYAGRGCEIYNNTINGNPTGGGLGTSTHDIMLRGGAGLIFYNNFFNTSSATTLGNENYNVTEPTYPEYINDVWIWSNSYTGITDQLSVNSGVGIVAGINYFSDAPIPTTPAPPKPGYTPYTYPHPLVP